MGVCLREEGVVLRWLTNSLDHRVLSAVNMGKALPGGIETN